MKIAFYFMLAFIAMIFLFGGVLKHNDVNLNTELHGLAVQPADAGFESASVPSVSSSDQPNNTSDIIVVYPYKK